MPYRVVNVVDKSPYARTRGLGQNRNTNYPHVPSDAPEEVLRRDQECNDLYDKLYDIWQEYWDCYESEETIPCKELEQVMDEAKKKYEAGCVGTSIPECKELYDDWYDAWIEHSRVCVDRPYSEKCAEIYYGKYWPAAREYEDCVDSLNRLLDNWRKPQGNLPSIPSQDLRTATAAPRTTPRSTVVPQNFAPVATPSLTPTPTATATVTPSIPSIPSFQNVTTPLTSQVATPTLPTVQTPATTSQSPASSYQEGSSQQECPPGQFPEYPGGPCRAGVATGGLPGLPGGFGTADASTGTMTSPVTYGTLGRAFRVVNVR